MNPEESAPAESERPSKGLMGWSWILAILCVGIFYELGRGSEIFGGIYQDFNARVPWYTAMLVSLTWPWTVTASLLIAACLILKDRRISLKAASRINRWFFIGLILLAVLWIAVLFITLFQQHGGIS